MWSQCPPVEVLVAALTGFGGESRGVALSFDAECRVLPFPETPLLAHNAFLSLRVTMENWGFSFSYKHVGACKYVRLSVCAHALPAGLWAARARSRTLYTDGGKTAWSPLWPAPSLTCSWCGQTHCGHTPDTKWTHLLMLYSCTCAPSQSYSPPPLH